MTKELNGFVGRDIRTALLDKGIKPENIEYEIKSLSVRELFDIYLTYNGIIGYTETLIEALADIKAAKE